MKQLKDIHLTNEPNEIYQLFTQLYPELVIQVKEWNQWGEYTDDSRGLALQLYNGSKLLFSIRKFDEEGWCVIGCYMVPSYMNEIPEMISESTPAKSITPINTPEELMDIFCLMFPNFKSEIISVRMWRRFNDNFKGVMIDLRDRKTVLFAVEKREELWNARYPILVPAPDEEDLPTTEIERIIMSDILIFE